MPDKLNIPLVISEPNGLKINKLIFNLGCIIIIAILLFYYYLYDDIYITIPYHIINQPIPMVIYDNLVKNGMREKYDHMNILAKTITIYNLNKNKIPITGIIIIENNRNARYFPIASANIFYPNKTGINIQFVLPEVLNVKQLVLDTAIFCDHYLNIATSQIEISDENNKVIWNNHEPLKVGKRYNYIDMIKPVVINETPSQKLCGGSACQQDLQENTLNTILQNDIWD